MQGAVRAIFLHGRNGRRDLLRPLGLVSSIRPIASPRYESSIPESTPSSGNGNLTGFGRLDGESGSMSFAEAKKLIRLVNVEELKTKLCREDKEVIDYKELLKACESMGIARSHDEAASFAHVLEDAGVVLLFRDKVYLHPDKVVDLVRRSVPLALTSEDDPIKEEFKKLQERKEEIDMLAHKQVRRILWSGLGLGIMHVGLFFRLTFWEYSWDVMEPVTFFATTTSLLVGYAYFLFTSRDPSYQDMMQRLFLSRQRKLFVKRRFDHKRFKELQEQCKLSLDNKHLKKKTIRDEYIF